MGYPDNMDWGAFDDAHAEPPEHAAEAHLAAAAVYLASAIGMDWTEASELLDEQPPEVRDDMWRLYKGRPRDCLRVLNAEARRRERRKVPA